MEIFQNKKSVMRRDRCVDIVPIASSANFATTTAHVKPVSPSQTVKCASALPSFNREEVDGDIESVKTWIEKKKDEL
ncbi:hypothetical protein C0Q70_13615 [Pomacea canaliculata]|uniref:Uncharacterized protein n=1 Tax=Pomacea canaliculata TaxID=400727 RepID=A0A2T7NXQ0_POMCA|nr:hypothetical protein C0Q70_13615 [Pomacea canaliculata]